jgi:L-galactose dehydrogenase
MVKNSFLRSKQRFLLVQSGINYFDTSPFYGLTKSETILGKCLKGIDRKKYYISTKVGRYGHNEFDFSQQRTITSLNDSLKRLGLSYVDIVICHDIEFGDLDEVINETIPTLKQLRQQGKLRYIGISGLPLYVYRYVLERCDDIDVILTYCHWNLLDDTLGNLLPLLTQRQIGVINASPLAMGLLTTQGPPSWHPAAPSIKQICREAVEYCNNHNLDISQVSLSFVVNHLDQVATTLVGIQNAAQLKSNVEAISMKINPNVLNELKKILQPIHNKTWLSGRRENNGDIDALLE